MKKWIIAAAMGFGLMILCVGDSSAADFRKIIYDLEFDTPTEYKIAENKYRKFSYRKGDQDGLVLPCVEGGIRNERCIFILPEPSVYSDSKSDDFGFVVGAVTYGGTGVVVTMWGIYVDNGWYVTTPPVRLGDRIHIESVKCVENAITINAVVQGPDDPLCCPTQKAVLKYRLERGKLVSAR
ncbi:hypothetical protein FVW20_10340 [Desulfovibrio oxamicus]|uniref:Uncharacterized protein n=1 Tax=Nitratidesulfovibrio oxamicus TaxID=32016 RepID=A0ABS0J6R9_9BACT|nr:hypothetical protein [Nitratidesulfovibrio oxamicus]MBG3877408.1 hypothetical protein [Nitratidesulfovibrio oxamicus]